MSEAVTIQQCAAGDELALSLIGQATFLETFAGILSGADIIAHCGRQHSVEKYRELLKDVSSTLWLAAIAPGRTPIGYLVLTKPDLPLPSLSPKDTELKRIYLLGKFQGRGIGQQLMAVAIERAKRLGMDRLLLGVYAGNKSAIGFYQKSGFKQVGERRFKVGENTYDDFIFARNLAQS